MRIHTNADISQTDEQQAAWLAQRNKQLEEQNAALLEALEEFVEATQHSQSVMDAYRLGCAAITAARGESK